MLVYVDFGAPINDYCEVYSFSFGVQSASGTAAGGATTRAQRSDMSFSKSHDSFSGKLFNHCASGTVFKRVSVELYRDEDSDVLLVYTMADVIIASVQSSGNSESAHLDYGAISYKYYSS
jgi:type VI protein secretion system component Hcp